MSNPRSTRQRKRRTAGLKPHERGLLTGEHVPGMNPYAWSSLHRKAPNDAQLAERVALVERHADRIPAERRPILERYVLAWRGEIGPGDVLDPSRWWKPGGA